MNDLPNIDPGSWAYESLIGQLREWTPKARIRNVTASANISPLDGFIRADATSAAITLTLETAVGADGRVHIFKKIDSSSNAVTIDGNGTETIDGASSYSLSDQYDRVTLVSNGTNWEIVAEGGSGAGAASGAFGQVQLTKNGANLQLAAYKGNNLTFADGTVATISSALTLAATGASASTLYYIYATYSGTTVNAIEKSTTAWTTTNGIAHMTGNTAKAFVGWARTTSGSAWADTGKQRFVCSYYNQGPRVLQGDVITSTDTASTSYVEVDAATTTERVEWVQPANASLFITHSGRHRNDTAGSGAANSMGIDGTSNINTSGTPIECEDESTNAGDLHSFCVSYGTTVATEGYHFATGLVKATTSGKAQSVASLAGIIGAS